MDIRYYVGPLVQIHVYLYIDITAVRILNLELKGRNSNVKLNLENNQNRCYLLTKKLSILIIRWILDSYLRQSVCVMWDSRKSEYFKMYNGVKQGGVISCHLFNLYIDPLLVQLSNSGYGCHIAGVYAGALSYADDITLLCPSVWGLNEMLKICNKYILEKNIIFNSKKMVCIKFGSTIIEEQYAFFLTV